MFARFNENPAMTLQDIKETKRYGRTDGQTDTRTDGRTDNVKTVYPLQTKFAGGIKKEWFVRGHKEKVVGTVNSNTHTFCLFVCFCCFTSHVNSYGHCGTVSSLNHTFSWAGLSKRLTSNLCTYFRL